MTEIMSNVHRIMARYNLDFDLPSGHRISLTEHMRKQRSLFLERMGTYSKNAENREKTLAYILAWLEEWSKCLEVFQRKITKSATLLWGISQIKEENTKEVFQKMSVSFPSKKEI